MSEKGFSLTEILVAIVLVGVMVLAVTSIDISSRRFFGAAKDATWIQDEAKIAMAHITKNIQQGGGDSTSLGAAGPVNSTYTNGFFILDGVGNIQNQGSRIYVRMDRNGDGSYDSADSNPFIEYIYRSTDDSIWYDPIVGVGPGGDEQIAEDIVANILFQSINANEVKITITVRRDPSSAASLDNPQTTLTSSTILRAMSTN
jgi:prepilin-type N-terminal cleavage/methylation domain-containing protein